MSVRIHGFGVAETRFLPLQSAAGADTRPKVMAALADDGYTTFSVAETDIASLARGAIDQCLAATGADAAAIDAVIIATESFWDVEHLAPLSPLVPSFEHLKLRDALLAVLCDAGLSAAVPYGSWLGACGNCGSALATAYAMVSTGIHARCMVVIVDKQRPDLPRFMDSGAAVLGDAAVAMMVDGEHGPGYAIDALAIVGAPDLSRLDPTRDFAKLVIGTHRAVRRLAQSFEKSAGAPLDTGDEIIAGSFHPQSLKIICDTLKIRPEHLQRDARVKFGHAYAADPVLTLSLRAAAGQHRHGQSVVLLNSGVWSWALIKLRYC
jgi:3-oxoacyl-[acyl-carrier-protein] synthase III